MDFARKILNKYGWKEGEGLGKHSDGILKPLKASMKFDNAGLGSDQAASDFNNHWWERVFNEAAGNVAVVTNGGSSGDGVCVELKNKEDSVEITTKSYSLKKLKKAKAAAMCSTDGSDARYHNFLQSETLTKSGDEIEKPNKIGVADISVTQYKTLTDEELFRACGGRTAHKGARHGLKLSGKLSRIEKQEQELLARMQERCKMSNEEAKKRVDQKERMENERVIHVADDKVQAEVDTVESFKKSKKRKAKDTACNNSITVSAMEVEVLKGKKKKKHRRECDVKAIKATITTEEDNGFVPKKQRKIADDTVCNTDPVEISMRKLKKSRKNKSKKS